MPAISSVIPSITRASPTTRVRAAPALAFGAQTAIRTAAAGTASASAAREIGPRLQDRFMIGSSYTKAPPPGQ
jgi:hypothetical protein